MQRNRGLPSSRLAAALMFITACATCCHRTERPPSDMRAPPRALSARPNPFAGCTMCHVDVEDELEGGTHVAKRVGCVACHGPSKGHVADENNEVKPDELFPKKDTDRLCGRCHKCSQPAAERPAQRKVCTECHGAHAFPKTRAASRPGRSGR